MADEGGRGAGSTYFIVWTVKREGVILPEERLPAGQTVLVGLQHVVAMFGATVLAPLLMGFDSTSRSSFPASRRSSSSW